MSLRFTTLNIERSKHWDTVLPFLERTQADVLCLQEIFEYELHRLHTLGYHTHFAHVSTYPYDDIDESRPSRQGVALCTRAELLWCDTYAYHQASNPEQFEREIETPEEKRLKATQQIVVGCINHEGAEYVLSTTHFPVTKNGLSNEYQRQDMTSLLEYVSRFPSLILAGDFNIPRGVNELYERLVERYTDHIPEGITGSLDVDIHRAGQIPEVRERIAGYMVDYIFSTPDYKVKNVQQHFGISDHTAFTAEIEKVK